MTKLLTTPPTPYDRLTQAHDAIMAAGYHRGKDRWIKDEAQALKVVRTEDGKFIIQVY